MRFYLTILNTPPPHPTVRPRSQFPENTIHQAKYGFKKSKKGPVLSKMS